MAATKALPAPIVGSGTDSALRAVREASDAVIAAKRTRSVTKIEGALDDLQAAVDAARNVGIQWGPIGSVLGIARGNAYQRFRKKTSGDGGHPAHENTAAIRLSA